jgi:hypothetical protein
VRADALALASALASAPSLREQRARVSGPASPSASDRPPRAQWPHAASADSKAAKLGAVPICRQQGLLAPAAASMRSERLWRAVPAWAWRREPRDARSSASAWASSCRHAVPKRGRRRSSRATPRRQEGEISWSNPLTEELERGAEARSRARSARAGDERCRLFSRFFQASEDRGGGVAACGWRPRILAVSLPDSAAIGASA